MNKQDIPQETLLEPPVCGIVMPISAIDGCDESHWKDVLEILSASIRKANHEPNLVSNDADIGVIPKRIVQNLYSNPVIVCDVSGRNANVMFELGMRLAFDKPVVIIKDDKTPYSFDTSSVEHLTYPRDLRFRSIVEFQSILSEKILNAANSSNSFLASFGTFKVAEIKEETAGALEIVLDEIGSLKAAIRRVEDRNYRLSRNEFGRNYNQGQSGRDPSISLMITGNGESRAQFTSRLKMLGRIEEFDRRQIGPDRDIVTMQIENPNVADEILKHIEKIALESKIKVDDVSVSAG